MKTAIITGAYGTIGREIAKGLATANYNVILLGRNVNRLSELQQSLKTDNTSPEINYYQLDLSVKEEIFQLSAQLTSSIDVLINNAAIAPRRREINQSQIEMQWATNVLGYYWMMMAFKDHLMQSPEARIVNVASYWAGGLDLDDPEFKVRSYNNDLAYRQAKQADRMMTYDFAERFKGKICVNSCHPGDANSKLSNDLGFGGSDSAKTAAKTPVYLATSADISQVSGEYFTDCRQTRCHFKGDRQAIKRLINLCEQY